MMKIMIEITGDRQDHKQLCIPCSWVKSWGDPSPIRTHVTTRGFSPASRSVPKRKWSCQGQEWWAGDGTSHPCGLFPLKKYMVI